MTILNVLSPAVIEQGISLRAISPDDGELLYRIYASTREEELAPLGWTPEQQTDFLQMQFHAQHTYYQQVFSAAEYAIVLRHEEPIGRLYLDQRPTHLHIIDIALLPEARNHGFGSGLLQGILAEAKRLGVPVQIHVEALNPALRLYTRLGFQQIEDLGVYLLMEWQP